MKGIDLLLDIDDAPTHSTEARFVRIASKQYRRDGQEGMSPQIMMTSVTYLASLQLQLLCLLVVVSGTLRDTNMTMLEPVYCRLLCIQQALISLKECGFKLPVHFDQPGSCTCACYNQ